jgi:hypothetical protein
MADGGWLADWIRALVAQVHLLHDELATVRSGVRAGGQSTERDLAAADAERGHLERVVETHAKKQHSHRHFWHMCNRRYRAAALMTDHAHGQIKWMESEQRHIHHILTFVQDRLHELGHHTLNHTDIQTMTGIGWVGR